jgi:hypothetical protein
MYCCAAHNSINDRCVGFAFVLCNADVMYPFQVKVSQLKQHPYIICRKLHDLVPSAYTFWYPGTRNLAQAFMLVRYDRVRIKDESDRICDLCNASVIISGKTFLCVPLVFKAHLINKHADQSRCLTPQRHLNFACFQQWVSRRCHYRTLLWEARYALGLLKVRT